MLFVDPSSPVDWHNPLNKGLQCWLYAPPLSGWWGGKTFRDLTRRFDGAMTNMEATDWVGPNAARGQHRVLKFGGTDEYVAVPRGGGLNAQNSWTIELYVRWIGSQALGFAGQTAGDITGRQSAGGFTNHVMGIDNIDPNAGRVQAMPYAYLGYVTGATAVGDGRWRHIVMSSRSGEQRIYLDGRVDGTGAATGTSANSITIPLTIGTWIVTATLTGVFTGEVACVRTYNRMVGDGEAKALYKSCLRGYEDELNWVREWQLGTSDAGGGGGTAKRLLLLGVGA